MRSNLLNRILIALAAAIIIVYFYPHPEAKRFSYEEGKPWNYAKLIAPFDIPIHPDSATLQAAKDTLDLRFVPIYECNKAVLDTVLQSLPDAPGRQRLAEELHKIYEAGVVDTQTRNKIIEGTLPKVRILNKNVLSELSTAAFTSPREAYMYLDSIITDPELHKYFSSANLHELLQPNYSRNDEESRRHYEYDYLTLTADRGIILQGQTIIDSGTIVTSQDYTNLQTYETLLTQQDTTKSKNYWLLLLGQAGYVVMLLTALMLYLYYFCPDIYSKLSKVAYIYILVTAFFLVAVGLEYFVAQGVYIAPMIIVTILLLVFFNGRTAIFVTMALSLVCAGITSFALEYMFLQFCAATAAVYSLRELSRRAQLLRTSGVVAVAYIVAYFFLEVMMTGTLDGISRRMVIFLLVNAALTSMAYILMFAAERIFGFTSVVTLIELADINNPLLMRLSNECPGTFQHAIAVSNLAGDAAQRIGANVQLIRAGALYHDIGKLNNPAFCTENQHGVNPHDALSPEQSAAIIISHIKDGLALADKAGLPEVIRSFIREHHGAGLAKYFYITYCKAHPDEVVDKKPFTYPGPNPRSRETSVLMMADAIEAASRSLQQHTHEAIADLVNKIIDGQIADGLHNESTIAFRDIAIIKETFIDRLMTIYHSRIAYPTAPKNASTAQSPQAPAQ